MSFIEWATFVVLLVVGAVGLYGGLATLAGKRAWQEKPTTVGQREKVVVVVLDLSGGAVALAVPILWLLSRSH